MAHIKTFIDDLLTKSHTGPAWERYLLQHWNSILGNLQTHVSLQKILPEGTLVLGVANSAWLQELYLLSPMIMSTINAHFDQPHVKQIRFTYAPLKKYAEVSPVDAYIETLQPITLSSQEKRALTAIKDIELRRSLKEFLEKIHRTNQLK